MKRNKMRLTGSQLHHVIKESIKRVLRESVENIEDALYGLSGEIFDEGEIESLIKSNGAQIKWGDNGIDNGCDDEEDDYILYQSFDIRYNDGQNSWVTVYYGNNTRIIGDIEIR